MNSDASQEVVPAVKRQSSDGCDWNLPRLPLHEVCPIGVPVCRWRWRWRRQGGCGGGAEEEDAESTMLVGCGGRGGRRRRRVRRGQEEVGGEGGCGGGRGGGATATRRMMCGRGGGRWRTVQRQRRLTAVGAAVAEGRAGRQGPGATVDEWFREKCGGSRRLGWVSITEKWCPDCSQLRRQLRREQRLWLRLERNEEEDDAAAAAARLSDEVEGEMRRRKATAWYN